MPGLSFVYNKNNNLIHQHERHLSILRGTCISEDYNNSVLLHDDNWSLYASQYPGYPIASFDTATVRIVMEGKIYNKSSEQICNDIESLTEQYIQKQTTEPFQKWLLETDGEYVFFCQHKPTGTLLFLNDIFSNLKTFYAEFNNVLYLSRNFHFINKASETRLNFDRQAIALYLIFGYYPFQKTFCKDISVIEPACLISINAKTGVSKKHRIHTFNFDHKEYHNKSLKWCAKELAERHGHGAKLRCADTTKTNILMLSGGMDSRTVAASLKSKQVSYTSVSWLDCNKRAENDVEIAQLVASDLNVDWTLYNLPQIKAIDILRLLSISSGQMPLRLSRVHYMLKPLKDAYAPDAQIISGNFGWSLRYPLPGNISLKSTRDLTDYLIRAYGIFPTEIASNLTGVSEQEIIEQIRLQLDQYPEQSIAQKNAHFIIHERGFNWLLTGGDRHRHYLWHTYPDLSLHFFRFAMNCPDALKKDYRLYNQVLKELAPSLIHIPKIAGPLCQYIERPFTKKVAYGCYLANPFRLLKKYCFTKPKQAMTFSYQAAIKNIMSRQLSNTKMMQGALSINSVNELLSSLEQYSPQPVIVLLTLLSSIEYCCSTTNSFEQNPEEIIDFDPNDTK